MRFSIRTMGGIGAVILLAVAGLLYSASDRLGMVGHAVGESREATLHAYRIAQSLKSLANGYELAMNEYYSTVLEYPVYRQKVATHQAAIETELAALAKVQGGDAGAVAGLHGAFKELETFRAALEGALAGEDKDWDGAREALFKVNVVSVRGIQQADLLARIANERAVALDATWQEHQARALTTMRIALVLALAAAALGIIGAIRCNRIASP